MQHRQMQDLDCRKVGLERVWLNLLGAQRASSRLVLGTEDHPTLPPSSSMIEPGMDGPAPGGRGRGLGLGVGWLLSRILAGGAASSLRLRLAAEGGAAGWRRKKRRDRDTGACMSQILGVGDWGTRRPSCQKACPGY